MSVLAIVAPVFALIAIGYGATRLGQLSGTTGKALAEFAFTLAMPALLFRTLATAKDVPISPLLIWLAYFGAVAVAWLLAMAATRLLLRRPAEDMAAIAMTAVYGNIVMIGIPLNLATFGEAAVAPMAVILSINTPLLWFLGTMLQAMATRSGSVSPLATALGLIKDLARNPLILAILAGGAWRLTGWPLPALADGVLALLAQAGIPAALVSLGASLTNFAIAGQTPTLVTVIVLKLLIMPVIAALICLLLDLPPVVAGVVILFAAMPAGSNSYLFAMKFGRVVNSAAGAAALGTFLSAVTSLLLVAYLAPR
jgi:predicted permease